MMNFVSKTKDCVSKTRNFVLKMDKLCRLLVTEPLSNGTLSTLLTSSGAELPWSLRVRIATGVASASAHLYSIEPAHAPLELTSSAVYV